MIVSGVTVNGLPAKISTLTKKEVRNETLYDSSETDDSTSLHDGMGDCPESS